MGSPVAGLRSGLYFRQRNSQLFIRALTIMTVASLSLCLATLVMAQTESESRAANFIFLIDVSGSMISGSNMVTTRGGEPVTLFEALRGALVEIARDERLIAAASRVAFITFGTGVQEKSHWPTRLNSAQDRNRLVELISSTKQLSADPHGDTYMAKALRLAYRRAQVFSRASERCTVNFIVMLTDGWDQPPRGAGYKLKDVAPMFVRKQNQLRESVGVNTWQVRVIGLQNPPQGKQGITTAPQVADMLGGQFLDLTSQQAQSVPEKIYAALKSTLQGTQGEIELTAEEHSEYLDVGKVRLNEESIIGIKFRSRSCRDEKITGVDDRPEEIESEVLRDLSARLGRLTPITGEVKNDLRLRLGESSYLIPGVDKTTGGVAASLSVRIGQGVEPGAYVGRLAFLSTAKVTAPAYYVFRVPSRIEIAPAVVKARVRKKGLFSSGAAMTRAPVSFNLLSSDNRSIGSVEISLSDMAPAAQSDASLIGIGGTDIALRELNRRGNPLRINPGSERQATVFIEIAVSADVSTGHFEGRLAVDAPPGVDVYPAEALVQLTVMPSYWEEFRLIVITTMLLLVAVGILAALSLGLRRR